MAWYTAFQPLGCHYYSIFQLFLENSGATYKINVYAFQPSEQKSF